MTIDSDHPYIIGIQTILELIACAAPVFVLIFFAEERLLPTTRQFASRYGRAVGRSLLVQAVLTLICFIFLFLWRDRPFPFSTPYLPWAYFFDLNVFQGRFEHLHSAAFFDPNLYVERTYQYPGAAALLYEAFYVTHHAVLFFGLVALLGVVALATGFARALIREGLSKIEAYGLVIFAILLSYPLGLELGLGNLELCIFFLTASGLWCFFGDRKYGGAVLLGIAAGMKLYPAIYLGLYLARKEFKALFVAAACAVALNIAGLWLIGPSIAYSYRQVKYGLAVFRLHYMRTYLPAETGIDHSLYGFIKRFTYIKFPNYMMPDKTVTLYLALAAGFGAVLWFARIQKLPVLNQVTALCVASIVLPPTSHDYTLLHLYFPWAVLVILAVRAARNHTQLPGLLLALLCYAYLFAPESELIRNGRSFEGQTKCLALLVLLYASLRYPWNWEQPHSGSKNELIRLPSVPFGEAQGIRNEVTSH